MDLFDLHRSALGKKVSTPEHYDASLLFRIPRSENREQYHIDEATLPFVGYDVWNCYELSFLTDNGLPLSRVVKIIYPADSIYLVESKSLKMYLNAFNMDCFGHSVQEAENQVFGIIRHDLMRLLETNVRICFFDTNSSVLEAFPSLKDADLMKIITLHQQESISFSHFTELPELLRSVQTKSLHHYAFRTDLLRSNCRVTNQPDWGDLFVKMSTLHEIEMVSILEYLVSFRKENHFHEEVVEMIYKRFLDVFEPEKLMVAAMYTRRGGIDINPIRASHVDLLDEALTSISCRVEKTLRQ